MILLREMRKRSHLTQAELAKLVGVTQAAISQWEIGTARPSFCNLAAIAKALGCTVDELIAPPSP